MKPAASPVLHSVRLLDQLRERIRYKHYSLRTEQSYVLWVKSFVKWHGLRHPRDMGGAEVHLRCPSIRARENSADTIFMKNACSAP